MVYADVSASMQFAPKAALLHLTLLQLTYSLWRASDRVRLSLYSADGEQLIDKRNLKAQLERLMTALGNSDLAAGRDATDLLREIGRKRQPVRNDLLFVVSDFVGTSGDASDIETWLAVTRAISCDVVPVVISFELPDGQFGSIRLWDPEARAQRLTFVTPARLRAINAAERERVDKLERLFRRAGLDYLVLRRDHDVYPELARLANWRRKRRN